MERQRLFEKKMKKVQKKQSGYILTQDAPFPCHKTPQPATM
jgi:hypothetical protein